MFVGPAIAGGFMVAAGVGWTLVFSAFCVFCSFAVLWFIKPLREEHRKGGSGGGLISDIVEGVRYVVHHPGIGPMLLVTIGAAVLLRPLSDLLPGFTDVIFGRGEGGLATFMTFFGVGGLLGSIWIANRNRMHGTLNIFLAGTLALAVLILAFTLTESFSLAVILIMLIGLTGSTLMNSSQILIQSGVEGSIRARVISLYALNYRTAPSVGAMMMGGASSFFGLQIPVAAGALLFLLVWLWMYRNRNRISGILEADPPRERAAPPPATPITDKAAE